MSISRTINYTLERSFYIKKKARKVTARLCHLPSSLLKLPQKLPNFDSLKSNFYSPTQKCQKPDQESREKSRPLKVVRICFLLYQVIFNVNLTDNKLHSGEKFLHQKKARKGIACTKVITPPHQMVRPRVNRATVRLGTCYFSLHRTTQLPNLIEKFIF